MTNDEHLNDKHLLGMFQNPAMVAYYDEDGNEIEFNGRKMLRIALEVFDDALNTVYTHIDDKDPAPAEIRKTWYGWTPLAPALREAGISMDQAQMWVDALICQLEREEENASRLATAELTKEEVDDDHV